MSFTKFDTVAGTTCPYRPAINNAFIPQYMEMQLRQATLATHGKGPSMQKASFQAVTLVKRGSQSSTEG